MKKAVIFYFSGTGNTKKVVDAYCEAFANEGVEVKAHSMEKELDFNLDDIDMLGVAYPIYAFSAPTIVTDFLKKLPKRENKTPLFIIKTSGEPLALNNISSVKVKRILKRRNYILSNEYHYVMPYNIIFRHSDNMAYKMWKTASEVIPIEAKEIVDGKKVKLPYFPFGTFLTWIFSIEHWGGRFNGKKYKVNEKCIKCQACVRRCPTGNISIDEKGNFHFGKNCLMCMRCSFHCPTNAIKIGLFEGWKVNGAYNFNNPGEEKEEKHKHYCKKSYKKYFAKKQAKIDKYLEEKVNNKDNN